jgi:hypothetical protein
MCQDMNCGVVGQGPMLPRGLIFGGGATSCAGALHPVMVTAKDDDDDDDDASSTAKGSKVGLLYRQNYAYLIHGN